MSFQPREGLLDTLMSKPSDDSIPQLLNHPQLEIMEIRYLCCVLSDFLTHRIHKYDNSVVLSYKVLGQFIVNTRSNN